MFIVFVQRRPNVFDVGPTLYNCHTNALCLLGTLTHNMGFLWNAVTSPEILWMATQRKQCYIRPLPLTSLYYLARWKQLEVKAIEFLRIQMKREKLSKTFIMILNWKSPLISMVYTDTFYTLRVIFPCCTAWRISVSYTGSIVYITTCIHHYILMTWPHYGLTQVHRHTNRRGKSGGSMCSQHQRRCLITLNWGGGGGYSVFANDACLSRRSITHTALK